MFYLGMVITSPRCARGVIKSLAGVKLDENWQKKPIFVVGETTARLINKELSLEPIGADSGNATALIPTILKCIVLEKKNKFLHKYFCFY